MPVSQNPVYNLKVVLRETKISADTLRAWERRYGLPKPQRTPGGHRLYSQYDIEMVRWLMARQAEGLSISRAVDLWKESAVQGPDPLSASASETAPLSPGRVALPGLFPADFGLDTMRSQWVAACLAFNETVAEQVLNQAFAMYPVETVCRELLQKGLGDLGELWHTDSASVQQEHFATSLALRRLDALIAASPAPTRPQVIVTACPPGEWHNFPLLMITLFLRRRGLQVVYLGANVPLERFTETVQHIRPDLVVLSAQRLLTANTLKNVAFSLSESGVPIGYGGGIFNRLPVIQERVSGFFLGDDLTAAIQNIEKLISTRQPARQVLPLPDDLVLAHREFQKRHALVGSRVAREAADSNVLVEQISTANSFMAQNLSAALELGDVSLLATEIDWSHDHFGDIPLGPECLPTFMSMYARAVEAELGVAGRPIVAGLVTLER